LVTITEGSGVRVKIARKALDKLFSNYIRARANWRCERCGNMPAKQGLHCHHFHRRRHMATRYEESNCVSLCFGCHQYLGENKKAEEAFFLDRLGQEEYDQLMLRANNVVHIDLSAVELYLRQKLRELQKEIQT